MLRSLFGAFVLSIDRHSPDYFSFVARQAGGLPGLPDPADHSHSHRDGTRFFTMTCQPFTTLPFYYLHQHAV